MPASGSAPRSTPESRDGSEPAPRWPSGSASGCGALPQRRDLGVGHLRLGGVEKGILVAVQAEALRLRRCGRREPPDLDCSAHAVLRDAEIARHLANTAGRPVTATIGPRGFFICANLARMNLGLLASLPKLDELGEELAALDLVELAAIKVLGDPRHLPHDRRVGRALDRLMLDSLASRTLSRAPRTGGSPMPFRTEIDISVDETVASFFARLEPAAARIVAFQSVWPGRRKSPRRDREQRSAGARRLPNRPSRRRRARLVDRLAHIGGRVAESWIGLDISSPPPLVSRHGMVPLREGNGICRSPFRPWTSPN